MPRIARTAVLTLALLAAPSTLAAAAPVTPAPDLTAVTVDPTSAYGTREAATFCFDEPLAAATAAGFVVRTYDASRYAQGRTAVVAGSCATVAFDPRIDVARQGSVGEVDSGAVTGAGGAVSGPAGLALTGSTLAPRSGQTTGPDLVGAAPGSGTSVRFSFDQPFDTAAAAIEPGRFLVVAGDGAETAGTTLVSTRTDGTEVTIGFPAGTQVATAARYRVGRAAVRTPAFDGVEAPSGPFAPSAATIPGAPGVVGTGATARPTLVGAARGVAPGQLELRFSSDLGAFDSTRVVAVRDNGDVEAAASSSPVSGSTTRRIVTFPPGGATVTDPDGVVAVIAGSGAASSASGPAPASTAVVGDAAPFTPGRTNAPDLVEARTDPTSGEAVLAYDEPVAASGAASSFQLLRSAGGPVAGVTRSVSADASTVRVAFGATGIGVAAGVAAAVDRIGIGSGRAAVAFPVPEPAAAQPGPAAPGSGAPPTPTPVVPATPRDTRASVKVGKATVRRRRGRRTVTIAVTAGERLTVQARVLRGRRRVAGARRTLRSGRRTLRVRIPVRTRPGRLTVRLVFTDAARNSRTVVLRRVRLPRRR